MYLHPRFIRLCRCFFLQRMYLHCLDIHCCRCSFLDQCNYILLFSWLADALQPARHVQLHLRLAFSRAWGYFLRKFCICTPCFPYLADTPQLNYASTTCSFYTPQILPSKLRIRNLLFLCLADTLPSKFCIFNLRKSIITDISTKITSSTLVQQSSALLFI